MIGPTIPDIFLSLTWLWSRLNTQKCFEEARTADEIWKEVREDKNEGFTRAKGTASCQVDISGSKPVLAV
jgi:hypothetical protein